MVFNLCEENSVANQFMAEIRDKSIQGDRMKFRKNLERLGQIMAYQISRKLSFRPVNVDTPLGNTSINVPVANPILITVMRAGLGYFQGFVDYFDRADCGFIGAYRQEGSGVVNLDYSAAPSIEGKVVILIDPMLATGSSFIESVNAMGRLGTPAHIHIAALVASPQGIKFVGENLELPHTIWTWAIDDTLDDNFYIVPGLGDAGDLSFGVKL